MRYLGYAAAAGALAVALAGCGDPYSPRYGTSQSYYPQSGYQQSYYPQSGYQQSGYRQSGYSYYPSGPTYGSQSRSDYYRNYNGIHPESERTFP